MSTRMKSSACGCIVVYDSHFAPPMAEPKIINVRFEHSCPEHAIIPEWGARFEAMLALNRAKNSDGS